MLNFPQLTSGSVCQFPVRRRASTRTVSNQLPGGDSIRMGDSGAAKIRWELRYANLTDGEFAAMEQLFEASEGRLSTFIFLDPTANLIMWSEDWTKPVWNADALLQVTVGIADPFGGTSAMQITNTAQAEQRILQPVGGASWFQYCFSVYLRCDTASTVQLVTSTVGLESRSTIALGPTWTRAQKVGGLVSTQQGISFGVVLPAGVRIQAFGAQAEAQPAAGHYKKTTDQGGVYPKTRFEADSLSMSTEAPNQNSCAVNLVSGLGS